MNADVHQGSGRHCHPFKEIILNAKHIVIQKNNVMLRKGIYTSITVSSEYKVIRGVNALCVRKLLSVPVAYNADFRHDLMGLPD
jgi:hypothetical protein